jgi:hypothetical protein
VKAVAHNLFLRIPELFDLAPSFGVRIAEPFRSAQVAEGRIFGDDALLMVDGELHPGTTASRAMLKPVAWKCLFRPRVFEYAPPSIYAGGLCSENHWHVLTDVLPEILRVDDGNMPILVSRKFRSFDVFEAFGIGRKRIEVVERPTYCHRLTVLPQGAMTMVEKVKALRGRRPEERAGTRKLYVSRFTAKRRRVINESEVVAALHGRGFDVVYPDQMSFTEQAAAFGSAATIVMPHGAAAANLVFSHAPRVIELQPAVGSGVTTQQLCRAIGADYQQVQCRNWGLDMRVDVGEMLRVLANY